MYVYVHIQSIWLLYFILQQFKLFFSIHITVLV